MAEKHYEKAVRLVYEYAVSKGFIPEDFPMEDITLVWFSKTLQNWKALVVTHTRDRFFYEVSYSGDKKEAYIDAYEKFDNVVVEDPDKLVINIYSTDSWDVKDSINMVASNNRIRVA